MAEIITMGEAIVEIMRTKADAPLGAPGIFRGPFPSGAPAIFIDTVARLGHSAAMISGVGRDDFGEMLVSRLRGDGVDTSLILTDGRVSTGCAFVTYFSNGERRFIFHIGNTPAVKAPAPGADRLDGCRFFHVMGCSVTADAAFGGRIVATARAAREKGSAVSFDPNIRPELMKDPESGTLISEMLSLTTVFMPGKSELAALSGVDGIENGVAVMFDRYPQMELIAVKDGARGSACFTRTEKCAFGVYPVEVADPTGAGDCFDAAFLCALLEGRSRADCLRYASAAAALNTAAFGPMEGDISRGNIEKLIRESARED